MFFHWVAADYEPDVNHLFHGDQQRLIREKMTNFDGKDASPLPPDAKKKEGLGPCRRRRGTQRLGSWNPNDDGEEKPEGRRACLSERSRGRIDTDLPVVPTELLNCQSDS
ncbi:hypothetical protein OPV22_019265 [Ensete ventricosum]|uniref:RIN4 pathogenic type III effector avirulence factor Avr cleavage site domain-containing protein n=1 Tax=Ensete ventricosum TaxID=4639 RepID=A0AAV8QHC9_ENSVE|nr:hypothetical protein OPV22_019265 [Ensete ventricosum]